MREWDFRTQTHNNKRVFGGKTWNGFVIVKSLGKYEQDTLIVSAIIVAMLLTRLPMKRGDRPTVSACIGVIILFVTMGLLHLIHFSSLPLVSAWYLLKWIQKSISAFLLWVKNYFLLTFIKNCDKQIFMKNLKCS